MNVTPDENMFYAMRLLTDAAVGVEPNPKSKGSAVDAIRARRRHMMDALHTLVARAMREGAKRMVEEVKARAAGPQDGQDRSAIAQAKDDAQADRNVIQMPRR